MSEQSTMTKDSITITITITEKDGAFAAYISRPKTLPAPAVVLQELFGVNADIRKTCDEMAEHSFLGVAPDLFWRQEPNVDLSNVTSEADWQHGICLYQAYDRDAGVTDIEDTIKAVRKLPECNGKVAILGYCLGGLMVFLTAVRCDGIDAAVAYHGGDSRALNRSTVVSPRHALCSN
jgi:carboxymethylenebutenolidase